VLEDYVKAIRTALPDDGIFVNELTQVGYLSRIAFNVRAPRSFIGPGYQGTLETSKPRSPPSPITTITSDTTRA
jgi:thiamine pyrophosphate-dependent acetolactate synthase large subunit-like protein